MFLVHVCDERSSEAFFLCFMVGHHAFRGGDDEDAHVSCWQVSFLKFFVAILFAGESGLDDAALVDHSKEVDFELGGCFVAGCFVCAEVLMVIHDVKYFFHDSGYWGDGAFFLPDTLSVQDDVQCAGEGVVHHCS